MMTDPNDEMLDDIFAQARAVAPQPSDDLMARVLRDAAVVHAPTPVAQPGFWERLSDALGGWPTISGLAAATVAGVWVGVAPPASVEDLTASWIGDAVTVDLFSDVDYFDSVDVVDG